MLHVSELCFSWKNKSIFKGASFHLNKSEIVSILGVSGIGKTTLFKLISGIIKPDSGVIRLGDGTKKFHEYAAYMKQDDLLLPWRTSWENMFLFKELGEKKKIRSGSCRKLKLRAQNLFKKLEIEEFANFYPEELSGGLKQRVALAGTLIQEKNLILLDEPFSSLDVFTRESLYSYIKSLVNESEMGILFITHDFRDAVLLSDKIFIITNYTIEKVYEKNKESLSYEDIVRKIKSKMDAFEAF
ncbi:MAG: ABC transporter ATP-binding protein [Victivallaceae bacterium]